MLSNTDTKSLHIIALFVFTPLSLFSAIRIAYISTENRELFLAPLTHRRISGCLPRRITGSFPCNSPPNKHKICMRFTNHSILHCPQRNQRPNHWQAELKFLHSQPSANVFPLQPQLSVLILTLTQQCFIICFYLSLCILSGIFNI